MTPPARVAALDLGMQTVTMAVFERSGTGAVTLAGYARTGLVADPSADGSRAGQLKIALAELKAKLGWKSGRVACAIPSQGVFARFVKIPKVEPDKVGQVLYFEAQQNVPYPIEDVAWGYQVLPESEEDKLGALILATKLDQLESTVEALTSAGLTPDLIETSPVALYNAFRYNYPDAQGCSLVIDIGARATNLIFAEGDRLFIRTLPVGGGSISAALQKKFEGRTFNEVEEMKCADAFIPPPGNYAGAKDAEAAEMGKIARTVMTRVHNEITRSITFYRTNQHGSAPMRVFLAGGGASLPYTLEFFNEKLSLPIEFFNPLRRVGVAAGVDAVALPAEAQNLGECTGLALRALAGSCPVEIDLQAPSLIAAAAGRRRRPFLLAAAAVLVGALLLAGLYYDFAARRVTALNNTTKEQTEVLGKFKADLDQLTGQRRKLIQEAADLAAAPMLRSAWATLLNELNTRLPARNIWITQLRPMVGDQALEPGAAGAGWKAESDRRRDRDTAGEDAAPPQVTALLLDGLYLENENGPAVVDEFVEALAQSPIFGITEENKAAAVKLRATQSGNAWAYDYQLVLPLVRPIPL
ncbi:MAG: type IV pilus assembly protein PilM [Chthoniobacterales bacterium]